MKPEEMKPIEYNFPMDKTKHIIKVIGVGGGGGNAVQEMYKIGVKDVNFLVCNTDSQALAESPVPVRVQLGEDGLGVGGDPEKGRLAAEQSMEQIEQMFDKDTHVVIITAGMGGGTGTGASPLIAKAAREHGLLTIGVVTLPFLFERKFRREKALKGIAELKENVDALLVVNNQRLLEIYNDNSTTIEEAFGKANEVLTTATKTIAEIITNKGIINRDFCDVETVMKNGGAAIVSVGYAEGENRLITAMTNALSSPLINPVDIEKTKRLLYVIYDSEKNPVTVSETGEINQFMDTMPEDMDVLWGQYRDESLDGKVKVAIIATGFDQPCIPSDKKRDEDHEQLIRAMEEFYYPNLRKKVEPVAIQEKEEVPEEDSQDDFLQEENPPTEKRSWLKAIYDFAKRALEEDE